MDPNPFRPIIANKDVTHEVMHRDDELVVFRGMRLPIDPIVQKLVALLVCLSVCARVYVSLLCAASYARHHLTLAR